MGLLRNQIIVVSIFSLFLILMFSQIHEVTHQTINTYYGCDSNIIWNFLEPEMYQETLSGGSPAFMSTHSDCNEVPETMILAHSINEVVGYNIMTLLELFFIFCISVSFFIIKGKNITIKLHKKRKGAPNVIIIK
jgi:hypothetical protein